MELGAMDPRVSEEPYPPAGLLEVGAKAYETRDTELAIRTRAGIAVMLSEWRRLHIIERKKDEDGS